MISICLIHLSVYFYVGVILYSEYTAHSRKELKLPELTDA